MMATGAMIWVPFEIRGGQSLPNNDARSRISLMHAKEKGGKERER